jgi:hypothetical protein
MRTAKQEKKLIDFATKKTIHVSMSTSAHAGFKIECFKHGLSMQEAIEEFANLVSIGHSDMIAVLDDTAKKKLQKQIRKIDGSDTETIYGILELENPLKDNA